ncbi:hypothetical protein P4O66_018718 [Electrophorus voltai]|uniref:Uncharacterized protein n=1 Tax=Electrophorus voltai TaxID=2609070 RepID=A0AAD8YS61_9TELE|nr:hypothetical protein P4O66_018718 [Electrophorus voltai]
MEGALKKVEAMEANMGGAEFLRPLEHIYSQAYIPNHPSQGRETKDPHLREQMVELGMQAGLGSAFTNFIGVHRDSWDSC